MKGPVLGRGVGRRGVLRLPVFGPWDSTNYVVGYDMLCPNASYNPECSCCQAFTSLELETGGGGTRSRMGPRRIQKPARIVIAMPTYIAGRIP